MGTVLVTGGAGYIGGQATVALRNMGERVIVLDDRYAWSDPPKGLEFICGSVLDRRVVSTVLRLFDVYAVVHLAAYVDVEGSFRMFKAYFHNNTYGTEVLVDESNRAGVSYFVFSSTAAVYGTPDISPVPESAPLHPESPYGESKMQAEEIVRRNLSDSRSHMILRYFNVAGADPFKRAGYAIKRDATHLVRRAILAALGVVPELTIFGTDYPTQDGTAVRDYIHVVDVAKVHVAALKHLHYGGKSATLNVGYGRGYTVLEVIEAVKKVSGSNFRVVFGDRRPGDVAAVVADPSCIKRVLKWKPQYDDLETIIRHEYEWVKSQLNR